MVSKIIFSWTYRIKFAMYSGFNRRIISFRTNTFQEIIDQAKSGPMIFSRTVMSVKDFITESHRNYFSTKQISESV